MNSMQPSPSPGGRAHGGSFAALQQRLVMEGVVPQMAVTGSGIMTALLLRIVGVYQHLLL